MATSAELSTIIVVPKKLKDIMSPETWGLVVLSQCGRLLLTAKLFTKFEKSILLEFLWH